MRILRRLLLCYTESLTLRLHICEGSGLFKRRRIRSPLVCKKEDEVGRFSDGRHLEHGNVVADGEAGQVLHQGGGGQAFVAFETALHNIHRMRSTFRGVVHQAAALFTVAAIQDTGLKIGGRLALNE